MVILAGAGLAPLAAGPPGLALGWLLSIGMRAGEPGIALVQAPGQAAQADPAQQHEREKGQPESVVAEKL
ncbi:hypothetical protein D9M68_1009550 [compost metagenome]